MAKIERAGLSGYLVVGTTEDVLLSFSAFSRASFRAS